MGKLIDYKERLNTALRGPQQSKRVQRRRAKLLQWRAVDRNRVLEGLPK